MAKTFTLNQKNWRWYADDGAEPTAALANENTAYTLSDNTTKRRLRVNLAEVGGGTANNVSFSVQYSKDESSWSSMAAGNAWNYADGAATQGNTLAGLKLSDTSTAGQYVEADGGAATYDYSASTNVEWDVCLVPGSGVESSTLYYFRFLINSAEVALGSGETHPQATSAVVVSSGLSSKLALLGVG